MSERDYIACGAAIDNTGRYRYTLWRCWTLKRPKVRWIMLNPSTADGTIDDPTIRRCVGFARAWGYGGIDVVNLYAYRTTDPRALRTAADAIGPDNDRYLTSNLGGDDLVVCGWGAHPLAAERAQHVFILLEEWWITPHCLGLTRDGQPRHPLYVRGDVQPEPLGKVVVHV